VVLALCECGCGQETNTGKRFVSGHNGKGRRKAPYVFSCEYCKKSTEVMPHQKNRVFCSAQCRDNLRRETTGEKHPNFRIFMTNCFLCGKETERKSKHGIKKPVYCSIECAKKSKSIKLSAAHSGKDSFSWNSFRNRAKIRDSGTCCICDFSIIVHVHHIIPRSKGGEHSLDNLITLCPNHHAMAHAGLISFV